VLDSETSVSRNRLYAKYKNILVMIILVFDCCQQTNETSKLILRQNHKTKNSRQ